MIPITVLLIVLRRCVSCKTLDSDAAVSQSLQNTSSLSKNHTLYDRVMPFCENKVGVETKLCCEDMVQSV